MSPRGAFRAVAFAAAFALALAGCNRGSYPTDINRPAPNFTIHDGSETVSLSQYRGKTVVLNFWASWCVYCALEWPSLEKLPSEVPNLAVIAIAFDSDPESYHKYLLDYRLHNMTVALDTTDQSNLAFGTRQPPESYVIDKRGFIRRKFIGAQDWSTPAILAYLRSL